MERVEKRWITFVQLPVGPARKTTEWDIVNNRSGDPLGAITWYGPWRQYCFIPEGDHVVFNADCLKDIMEFCARLTTGQRQGTLL